MKKDRCLIGATPSFCPEGGAVSPQRHSNCSGTSLGLHRQVRIHRFRDFWTRYLLHRSKPTHIQQRYHSMTQASIRGTPASRNNRHHGHERLSLYGVRDTIFRRLELQKAEAPAEVDMTLLSYPPENQRHTTAATSLD
jgi:hypothetical protein